MMAVDFKAGKVHYKLLLVLAALIPSGFYKLEGVLLVLLLTSWVFLIKGYKEIRTVSHPKLLLILFFMIMVLGLLYTTDVSSQWKYLGRKIAIFIIPLTFIGVHLEKTTITEIKKVFVFSLFLFLLFADGYALFDYLKSLELEVLINSSIYNKFTYYGLTRVFKDWHPTYVSLFLNMGLVFCREIYYTKRRYGWWATTVLFSIVHIFLLNSFTGIATFFLLSILFLLENFREKRGFLLLLLVLIVGLGFIFFVHNPLQYTKIDKIKSTPLKVTDDKLERNVLTLRLAKWKTSLDVSAKSPIIGVSNGSYMEELYQQYLKNGFMYCAKQRYSSHNQYLYTLTSNGAFGLILLVLILTVPLWLKNNENSLKPFLIIIACFFFTEDLLARQQGIVFFIFFYVLLTHQNPTTVGLSNGKYSRH